jgi:putative phosphoribosyl transferase
MSHHISFIFQDREHAGRLLGKKIAPLIHRDAVVVGMLHGGAVVAAALARELDLPFEVMPGRRLRHPADSLRSIGAVTISETCLNDTVYDIPQDFIYHQIAMHKMALQYEHAYYYPNAGRVSFARKTIVLVDDLLFEHHSMAASIRTVRKEMPADIMVAVPIVSPEASRRVDEECDQFVFLRSESVQKIGKDYFEEFPRVEDAHVKQLLDMQPGHSIFAFTEI